MTKIKGYGLLWALLAEAAIFVFFLCIVPRLSFERLLYRSAEPVSAETVRNAIGAKPGSVKHLAGYPCTESTGGLTSAEELKKNYIAALEADAVRLEATGIYRQVNYRTIRGTHRGYYSSNSRTYGVNAPVITRSRLTAFWMRPYADYAQYYLVTFDDGSRTWALIDTAITKIPRKGIVKLPVGYYWDEGAARFLTEAEKEKYHMSDRDILEDRYLGDAIDLCSGWVKGEEMEQYRETRSLIQSVGTVVTGALFFITLILTMLPERKRRGRT